MVKDLTESEATLWFLSWPQSSSFVAGAIALGVAAYIAASPYRGGCPSAAGRAALEAAWALLATFVLVMVANAPSIVSHAGGSFARLMLPASALITILLVWLLVGTFRGSPVLLHGILIVLTGCAVIESGIRCFHTAMNSSMEFSMVREAVAKQAAIAGPINELLIVKPPEGYSYVGPPPYEDEFDFISSVASDKVKQMYEQVLAANRQRPAVAALKREGTLFFDPAYNGTPCKKGTIYLSQNAVVADMAAPMHLAENPDSCVGAIARYSVTPVSDPVHFPSLALNAATGQNSFWETGPYPVVLTIDYPRAEMVTSYAIGTKDDFARTPTMWQLEASNGGDAWVPIDERSGISKWPLDGSVLMFQVENPGAYRAFRFTFLQGHNKIMRIDRLLLQTNGR